MSQSDTFAACKRALRLAVSFARKGDHKSAQHARIIARQLWQQIKNA